ncbi:hypothetical protein [uncultured Tateyamaria sp.]|uniref:hypothetical protein n=1 Tax=uncultured Tateyamaria sp. TaxID=455651 RepID=UPI00261FBBF1|nr:hypothetical protein [uncultured Tateyamaria sp.]
MKGVLKITLGACCLTSACSDTLVYGERSGVNIAIRSDGAEGQPLEINTGLERHVMGYVPPRDPAGGEAVSMIASFDLKRKAGSTRFEDKVGIKTVFVSGAAANSLGGNNAGVKAILDRPGVTASSAPSDQSNTGKILRWVSSDKAKAAEYLAFIDRYGGTRGSRANVFANTQLAASNGQNAALNAQFIALKKI